MIWMRILDLSLRVLLLDPEMEPSRRAAHATAATIAESQGVPAEMLLAVARTESSFDSRWVSRLEDGVRVTGIANRRVGTGPRFCGPLQTIAGPHWATCLAQRSLVIGYVVGARELGYWYRRAGGDWRAALCGFAGGNRGLASRTCGTYATRVLRRAERMGMATPQNERRNNRVKERRLALMKRLSPELECAKCHVAGLPPHLLEIDHIDGRPDYESNALSSVARVAQYEREHAAGVRLQVLCRRCNALGSGRRYGHPRPAAARDRWVS